MAYKPNIDIRSTIKYKELMKTYNLGPNGGILTSLNLYSTKIDDVLKIIEERSSDREYQGPSTTFNLRDSYVVIDTPGQIEIFTWSASGMIIASTLASALPTVEFLSHWVIVNR
jgi:GTPase SAR1 family protein